MLKYRCVKVRSTPVLVGEWVPIMAIHHDHDRTCRRQSVQGFVFFGEYMAGSLDG